MRTKMRIRRAVAMRTTLELPDPLFARLKARASSQRVTLKQLLHSYVEQGLNTPCLKRLLSDRRPPCPGSRAPSLARQAP
jgi:predicted DNA-binding ribbon-helix-helix protein